MKQLLRCCRVALATLPTGCSLFTSPMEHPLLTDRFHTNDGEILAIAATADRREVLLYPSGLACMEAPPDISENISASLSNQLSASAKTASVDATVQENIAHQIASAVAYAAKPSQGIMLYRNSMSYLCNEYVNRSLYDDVYDGAANKMLDVAVVTTFAELLLTDGKIGPQSVLDTTNSNTGEKSTKPDTASPASDTKTSGNPATPTVSTAGTVPSKENTADTKEHIAIARTIPPATPLPPPEPKKTTAHPASEADAAGTPQKQGTTQQPPNNLTGAQKVQMFEDFIAYMKTLTRSAQVQQELDQRPKTNAAGQNKATNNSYQDRTSPQSASVQATSK